MTKPPTIGQLIDQLERIRIKYRAQSEIANRLKAEYADLEDGLPAGVPRQRRELDRRVMRHF